MNSREITLHEICQAYHKQHSCGSFLEQTVDNKHFPPAKLLQKEGTLMLNSHGRIFSLVQHAKNTQKVGNALRD
jgi:hypothetical protein